MSLGRLGGVAALAATVLLTVAPCPPATMGAPDVMAGVEPATVMAYGLAGTFGDIGDVVPSGQQLTRVELPRQDAFAAGRRLHRTVEAGDGTLLMTGLSHNDSHDVPTGEMVVGAYDRRDHTLRTIRIATTTGRYLAVNRGGYAVAPTVSDLLPLPGGGVAFTAWPTLLGHDPRVDGEWPVFGVLTKVDGQWQVSPGNRWTGGQIGAPACPESVDVPGFSDCLRPGAMARLPASGDIIVSQAGGGLMALRLTGPDPAGSFSIQVTAHFRYPKEVLIRGVHANPTSRLGQERFVIGIDVPGGPGVVQEFSYDSRTGSITPASAPVLPGELNKEKTAFIGYLESRYDRSGNLWVSRRDGWRGGKLAVYTRPLCPHDPGRALDGYTTTSGKLRAWGRACPPDYDIVQAKSLRPAQGLIEDPATGTIVMLAQGGALLAVRMSSPGAEVSFEVGNVVDIGHKLLTRGETSWLASRLGAVDAAHRLWFPTARMRPSPQGAVAIDHFLMSINLDDLFAPPPIRLSGTPGRSVTVQAEHTTTTATSRRKGAAGTVEVDSAAFVTECSDSPAGLGCGRDEQPGDGFVIADDTGFGHLAGSIEYRVEVPAAGHYRLSYRVGTFEVTKTAEIDFTAAGRTYVTPVSSGGDWRRMPAGEVIFLPAGVQTITLSVRPGKGGWYLNSFTLQRV